jgi:hypothetical protein
MHFLRVASKRRLNLFGARIRSDAQNQVVVLFDGALRTRYPIFGLL